MPCRKLTEADVDLRITSSDDGSNVISMIAFLRGGASTCVSLPPIRTTLATEEFLANPRFKELKDEILCKLQAKCEAIHKALDLPLETVYVATPGRIKWCRVFFDDDDAGHIADRDGEVYVCDIERIES